MAFQPVQISGLPAKVYMWCTGSGRYCTGLTLHGAPRCADLFRCSRRPSILAGCKPAEVTLALDPGFYPSAVAYDPINDRFFVGSHASGTVAIVRRDGHCRATVRPERAAHPIVQLAYEPRVRRLWVLTPDAVEVVDVGGPAGAPDGDRRGGTRRPVQRHGRPMAPGGRSCSTPRPGGRRGRGGPPALRASLAPAARRGGATESLVLLPGRRHPRGRPRRRPVAGRSPVRRGRADCARRAAHRRLATRARRERRDRAPRRRLPRAGERDRDPAPERATGAARSSTPAPACATTRRSAARSTAARWSSSSAGSGITRASAATGARTSRRGSRPTSPAARPRRASPRRCRPPAPRWYADASSVRGGNHASATLQAGRRLHHPAVLRQPGRGRPRRRRARHGHDAAHRGVDEPLRDDLRAAPDRPQARTTACGSSRRAPSCPSPAIRPSAVRTPSSRPASSPPSRSCGRNARPACSALRSRARAPSGGSRSRRRPRRSNRSGRTPSARSSGRSARASPRARPDRSSPSGRAGSR